MGKKRGAPVVIVRKDKRLHKGLHLFAFAATGGLSGVATAAKAATNAGYNARTRKLQEDAADSPAPPRGRRSRDYDPAADPDFDPAAGFRRDHVPASEEYKRAHGG